VPPKSKAESPSWDRPPRLLRARRGEFPTLMLPTAGGVGSGGGHTGVKGGQGGSGSMRGDSFRRCGGLHVVSQLCAGKSRQSKREGSQPEASRNQRAHPRHPGRLQPGCPASPCLAPSLAACCPRGAAGPGC
jgi:hypothetical protein